MENNSCFICRSEGRRNSAILVMKEVSAPICAACYDELLMPAINQWRADRFLDDEDDGREDES